MNRDELRGFLRLLAKEDRSEDEKVKIGDALIDQALADAYTRGFEDAKAGKQHAKRWAQTT